MRPPPEVAPDAGRERWGTALARAFVAGLASLAPAGLPHLDLDRLNEPSARFMDTLCAWERRAPGVDRAEVLSRYREAVAAWKAEAARCEPTRAPAQGDA